MIDLRPDLLAIVQEILQRIVPACEVRAFGSRQKWTARETSDLDLVVIGSQRLPLKTMAVLKEAFEDSILPMRVDVLDWNAISEEFRCVIEAGFEVIHLGEASPTLGTSPAAEGAFTPSISVDAHCNAPDLHFALSDLSYPASWQVESLSNCLEDESVSYGIVQPGTPDPNGIPILRVNNFKSTTLDIADVLRVSPSIEARYSRTRLQGGEVLMTIVGSIGQVAIAPSSVAGWNVARAVCVLRPKSDIGSGWISLWLRSPFAQRTLGTGANTTVQTTVNLKDIKALPILLPPKDVREAIVHVLGTLDERIELIRRMNESLEAMARTVFKDWFIDFGPVRAKMEGREPPGLSTEIATLFPSKLVDSEFGEIPEGWDICPLSSFMELVGGGTPKTSEPRYWNGKFPWYSVVDAPSPEDVFVIKTQKSITQAGLDSSSTRLLPFGTTIISARGTVGKLAIVGQVMAMNQSCYGILCARGYDPYFTYFALKYTTHNLQANTHGSVFDTITRSTFESVFFPLPSNQLSKAFDLIVADTMSAILENLKHIELLDEIRNSILPRLLSGELAVPEEAACA